MYLNILNLITKVFAERHHLLWSLPHCCTHPKKNDHNTHTEKEKEREQRGRGIDIVVHYKQLFVYVTFDYALAFAHPFDSLSGYLSMKIFFRFCWCCWAKNQNNQKRTEKGDVVAILLLIKFPNILDGNGGRWDWLIGWLVGRSVPPHTLLIQFMNLFVSFLLSLLFGEMDYKSHKEEKIA